MSDGSTTQHAIRGSSSTRPRSGSEAIRMRVAHLVQTTTSADRPTVSDREWNHSRYSSSPHRNRSRDDRHKTSGKDKPLPITPSQPRALKRKKSNSGLILGSSDRPENRVPSTHDASGPYISKATSKQASARVFDALAHPPDLDHDLSTSFLQSRQHQRDPPQRSGSDDRQDRLRHDGFRGSLAAAEFDRMRKEIESLKEALQDSRKKSKRDQKQLDEVKSELVAANSTIKEKETELVKVKEKQKKNEEVHLLMLCQICMDLPDQPFAISPCGHVLCLLCLTEWFKKAPPTTDDMDIDPDELTDPHYILMRSKSCPTCRAPVKRRPVPVFMVKAISSTLKKFKGHSPLDTGFVDSGETSQRYQTDSVDPWKGIFPLSEESDSQGDDSADDYVAFDSDEFEDHAISLHELRQHRVMGSIFAHRDSSDSEEETDDDDEDDHENECVYVFPRWSPPVVDVHPNDRRLREGGPNAFKLLQRGCNIGMIQNFDVSYSHEEGIVVTLPSLSQLYAFSSNSDDDNDAHDTHRDARSRLFLGWNIFLSRYDIDGETFLAEMLQDIENRPARWDVTARPGVPGAKDARRLVRLDDLEAVDTTDSEVWVDAEDF
ncbi:hypothetical protein JR316_0008286 [Psilocybe cubensis]|uniref:Uncharacterized protein n=1 Tax=Psilocybe cubensis TaxID=181762 RepID=A0ACB8GVP1_PSICU|nr:hypothetical protein JR316_0008286 [Psilocybe cubensis]KAH9479691.1 hypothetical protein JR316_0008286 [Psilocybe cubensis]